VASDPEELLRSIERTREELANTVDTIAGRLDPKRVAKRSVDAMRDGVTTVIDGARVKLHLGPETGAPSALGSQSPGPETGASDGAAGAASARFAQIAPVVKRVPKPAAGGMAALLALAAIMAVRRARR
jgi:hypothetical protein